MRSPGEPVESLADRIKKAIRQGDDGATSLALYRCRGLVTDLAVHILRSDVGDEQGPSNLALRLAAELRANGLVEHTVWEEIK